MYNGINISYRCVYLYTLIVYLLQKRGIVSIQSGSEYDYIIYLTSHFQYGSDLIWTSAIDELGKDWYDENRVRTIGYGMFHSFHYCDVIMGTMASQITSLTIVYVVLHSGADQGKHQSSASLAFSGEFTGDRWIPRTNGQ